MTGRLVAGLLVVVVALAVAAWLVRGSAEPGPALPVEPPPPAGAAEAPPPRVPVEPVAAADPVSGRVLGPGGEPEPFVRVELQRVLSPWPALQTQLLETVVAEADGRFRFATARGPDLRVVVTGDRLARTEVTAAPLDPELVVRMEYGFRVRGLVRGPQWEPMVGCVVVLEPSAASNQRSLRTVTDTNGRFEFEGVRAGPLRLTARHARYGPVSESVTVGTDRLEQLRFSSRPALSMGGVVTAATDGRPLAGVAVRAYPDAWNGRLFVPFETTTAADGGFVLDGLDVGNMVFEFSHADFSTRQRLVSVSEEAADVAVELYGRTALTGALTGAPLGAGARLRLEQAGDAPVYAAVAEDGSFAFEDKVSVGQAELQLLEGSLCFSRSGSRRARIEVPEQEVAEVELAVEPASVTAGMVIDGEGAPIAGVRVLWRRPDTGLRAPMPLLAVTDAGGQYEVRGMPRALLLPGLVSTARFVFECEGFATVEVPFPGAAPGQELELPPVRMARPGRIRGRVTTASGVGVAGAVVFTGNLIHSMQKAVTGPQGNFELAGLPAGEYRLKVSYSNRPLWSSEKTTTVSEHDVEEVRLVLPAVREVRGEVRDPDGAPVSGAVILVRGMRGGTHISDANGSFRIQVPERAVDLEVFSNLPLHDFNVRKVVAVPARFAGELSIELPLVPAGVLQARVAGLPDRTPVAGGIVRLRSLDPASGDPVCDRQRNVRARWVEIAAGELRLEPFPAGRSELTLQCEGFKPVTVEVDVAAGQTVPLPDLLLEPGATVRGVVVDEEGAPIAGAHLHLGDEFDRVPLHVASEQSFAAADGSFSLSGVSASSGRIVAIAKGFAVAVHDLSLPADLLRPDPVRVVMRPGSTIEARVRGIGGGRGELYIVVLEKVIEGSPEPIDVAPTDEDGRVRFEHQGPGDYVLRVLGGSGESRLRIDAAGAGSELGGVHSVELPNPDHRG